MGKFRAWQPLRLPRTTRDFPGQEKAGEQRQCQTLLSCSPTKQRRNVVVQALFIERFYEKMPVWVFIPPILPTAYPLLPV